MSNPALNLNQRGAIPVPVQGLEYIRGGHTCTSAGARIYKREGYLYHVLEYIREEVYLLQGLEYIRRGIPITGARIY